MPTIYTASQADADLAEVLTWLEERNPSAALSVLEAIDSTMQLLAGHPQLGVHPEYLPEERFASVRVHVVTKYPNYLIFYRPLGDGIHVLRILHGARDLPTQFE